MISLFQSTFQPHWYGMLKSSSFRKYRIWHRILAALISLLIIFVHQVQKQADIASATTISQSASSTCVDLRSTVELGYCTDNLELN